VTRVPDWENRLAETLAEWNAREFRWDRDCARRAAACAIAVTGEDPLADLRSQYRTKREAMALLAETPMADRLDALFPRIHPAFAQRGDIALVEDSCLGIVLGGEASFYSAEGGVRMIRRSEWQAVWGVGHG